MLIYPAIDLFDRKAVRLLKGNYAEMTVYSDNPIDIAWDFVKKGANYIHVVDLEGARNGTTPNLDIIVDIKKKTGLFVEVGGGIRSMDVIDTYLSSGIDRVILGTAAVTNPELLKLATEKYGEKIAVGIDIKDGYVAIKGWEEKSAYKAEEFIQSLTNIKHIIVTDISKDGAMKGTNVQMYQNLSSLTDKQITASGGVSSMADIRALIPFHIYGAIIGKAYYTNAIDLEEAIEVAHSC